MPGTCLSYGSPSWSERPALGHRLTDKWFYVGQNWI